MGRPESLAPAATVGRRVPLRTLLSAILAALLSLLAFWPTLSYGFVNWDDPEYVTENSHLSQPPLEFLRWAASSTRMGSWHPLTWLSLRIDLWRGKGRAQVFHGTNLALHAANSALVVLACFLLFDRLGSREDRHQTWPALFVGCSFAAHPLHVESVAWISERKDVLFAFFWLLALISYLRFLDRPRSARTWYGASLVLFAASLASKPMAVVLVPILLLLDAWPYRRHRSRSWTALALEKAPFLVLGAVSASFTLLGHLRTGSLHSLDQLGVAARGVKSIWNLGHYLAVSIAPQDLSPLVPLTSFLRPTTEEVIGTMIFAAWAAVGWRMRSNWPGLGAGAIAFVALLAPVLGVLPIGSHATADRFAYLALTVPFFVVAGLAKEVHRELPGLGYALLALGALAVALLTLQTRDQIRHWSSTPALWGRVLEFAPAHPTALYNLGQHALASGDLAAARRSWRATVEVRPDHSQANNQLGNLALLDGNLQEAETRYRRAVAGDPRNVEAIYNLAITLERAGRIEEAVTWLDRFLAEAGAEYDQQRASAAMRRNDLLSGSAPPP